MTTPMDTTLEIPGPRCDTHELLSAPENGLWLQDRLPCPQLEPDDLSNGRILQVTFLGPDRTPLGSLSMFTFEVMFLPRLVVKGRWVLGDTITAKKLDGPGRLGMGKAILDTATTSMLSMTRVGFGLLASWIEVSYPEARRVQRHWIVPSLKHCKFEDNSVGLAPVPPLFTCSILSITFFSHRSFADYL